MKVSLVVVCHRSSGVAGAGFASFRNEARRAAVAHEIVAVEQSEDEGEVAKIRGLEPDRLEVLPNRGYAAGLNAGTALASGEVVILANPDLELRAGSLAALLAALDAGFDVAGPRIVGDQAAAITYPLAEDPRPGAELARIARHRWQSLWQRGLSPDLERAWHAWSAAGPVEVPALRGPLLAVRRSTLDRLGPLDEGYFLYFEETEWLLRARRRGARLAWVANAPVVHRGGHATEGRPDRARLEMDSRRRFVARNWPRWARRMERIFAPAVERTGLTDVEEVAGPAACRVDGADLWLIAPWRHLMPAAGCVGGDALPDSADEFAADGRWWALAARRNGGRWRVLGRWTWAR